MYDNTTDEFCSFSSGSCAAPKSCTEYTGLTAGASGNDAACLALRDKTGPICIYALATDVACSITTGLAICSSVATPASLEDCQIHTADVCHYASSACTLNTACASITTTG